MARVKKVDLDNVLLSLSVVSRWRKACEKAAEKYTELDPRQIPDEQIEVNPDGTLTIFVEIEGVGRVIELTIEASSWFYENPSWLD